MAECSDHYATAMTPRSPATTTTTTSPSSPSARSLSPSSPPPVASLVSPVVASPCAACKILRRRCGEKCVLAPYFPPSDPYKFTIAHRVFGASNINKFLRELPESQRADAVSSMVYEANARIRDPVYGCAGAICHLQKQVSELQTQLAQARAELVTAQLQQADLAALLCMKVAQSPQATTPFQVQSSPLDSPHTLPITNNGGFFDDTHPGSLWEPLWT